MTRRSENIKDKVARELGIVIAGGTKEERRKRVVDAIKKRLKPSEVSVKEAQEIIASNNAVAEVVVSVGQKHSESIDNNAIKISESVDSGSKLVSDAVAKVEEAVRNATESRTDEVSISNAESITTPVKESGSAIVASIIAATKAVIEVLGVLSSKVFTVRREQGEFAIPQAVILYDAQTGKPLESKNERRSITVNTPSIQPIVEEVRATLDSYKISDVDDASDPKYYGFLRANGYWYILRNTGDAQYRYVSGLTGYADAWTGRAALTYTYMDQAF